MEFFSPIFFEIFDLLRDIEVSNWLKEQFLNRSTIFNELCAFFREKVPQNENCHNDYVYQFLSKL